MIRIKKGETQSIYLTLTEKTSISNPYYLFQFISNDTRNSFFLISNDLSNNKSRFNKFNIKETSDDIIDQLNGEIFLYPGTYDYQIWETPVKSLDISLANKIIEIGLCKVEGYIPNYSPIYTGNDSSVNFVYNEYEIVRWILATNYWEDNNYWIDTETWND